MSEHKTVTPMQKVSPEMKQIREIFSNLGFEHVGLNRCETVETKYHEFLNYHELTSVRHAVKNDRTELFIKEVESKSASIKNTVQMGISFNYTGEEKEKVITVSITENSFVLKKEQSPTKILKEAIFLKPMDISSFKTFSKELLIVMNHENPTQNLKDFIYQCDIASSFQESEKKVRRLINKT